MIFDEFMASVSAELRTFLNENDIRTLDEAVKRADIWPSAHRSYPRYYSASDHSQRPSSAKTSQQKNRHLYQGSCLSQLNAITVESLAILDQTALRIQCCLNKRLKRITSRSRPVYPNFLLISTIPQAPLMAPEYQPLFGIQDVQIFWFQKRLYQTWTFLEVCCHDYIERAYVFPVVRCFLRCPYFEGWVDAVRAPLKFCSVLVGNVEGVRSPDDPDVTKACESPPPSVPGSVDVNAVQTRSVAAQKIYPLVLPHLEPLSVSPKDFSDLQNTCPALISLWMKASKKEQKATRTGSTFNYEVSDGLLYRVCLSSNCQSQRGKKYLFFPAECRRTVLALAHESPLAAHLSHRKTGMKVGEQFYWPGMWTDMRNYCKSCDKCQRMSVKGRVRPVPLEQLPIVTEPFSGVAIDIVGPLSPATTEGHRYILTLIDFATGFSEAAPLKEVTSTSVAEALLEMFSRVGFPGKILSDPGTQFTSQMMAELHRLLGAKPLFTTPYHPSGNGRVERFHSTLKASLHKLCCDKPRKWHRYLPTVLFALQEMPSGRTGFSAFDLLYGRAVRGPLSVLHDLWKDKKLTTDERSCFQYVIELKDRKLIVRRSPPRTLTSVPSNTRPTLT